MIRLRLRQRHSAWHHPDPAQFTRGTRTEGGRAEVGKPPKSRAVSALTIVNPIWITDGNDVPVANNHTHMDVACDRTW